VPTAQEAAGRFLREVRLLRLTQRPNIIVEKGAKSRPCQIIAVKKQIW
jgi:hypothetical protein